MPRAEYRDSFDERAISGNGRLIHQESDKPIGTPPPKAVFTQGTELDGDSCSARFLRGIRVELGLGDEMGQFFSEPLATLGAMDGLGLNELPSSARSSANPVSDRLL